MRTWYEFQNSGQKETTLFLYDEIGGFGKSAANFIEDLQTIPKDHRLVLRIHSPGGSILDGNAIFTALKSHPGGVTTQIDGLAASMASVVAIAGDPVRMAGNGMMMIHNASGSVAGDAEDMRKMADTIEKVQTTIERAYVGKTGMSRRAIRAMMDAETWMTASEAEEFGFVDEVTGDLAMAAHFDLSKFSNVPAPLKATQNRGPATLTEPETQMAKTTIAELEGQLETANDRISDFEAQIKIFEQEQLKLQAACELAEGDLVGFKAANETLKAEIIILGQAIEHRTAEVAVQAAKIAKLEEEAKNADERSREIAARVGANLLPKAQDAGTSLVGGPTDIESQLFAEKDPAKRTILFRKNREAIHLANVELKKQPD